MFKRYQQGGHIWDPGNSLTGDINPLRDLVERLEGMGFQQQYGQTPYTFFQSMTPENIMNQMRSKYDISSKIEMDPSMFTGLGQSEIASLQSGFYNPIRQEGTETALDKLQLAMGNVKSTGFAGTGRAIQQKQGIRDIYNRELSAMEGDIEEQQSKQFAGILDKINQWTKTGLDLRYG